MFKSTFSLSGFELPLCCGFTCTSIHRSLSLLQRCRGRPLLLRSNTNPGHTAGHGHRWAKHCDRASVQAGVTYAVCGTSADCCEIMHTGWSVSCERSSSCCSEPEVAVVLQLLIDPPLICGQYGHSTLSFRS